MSLLVLLTHWILVFYRFPSKQLGQPSFGHGDQMTVPL